MKRKVIGLTLVGTAVAALLAACGGGGGGGGDTAATPASVQLTGVAATGLALANSTVAVKCASGTGSATTNDSGSYTVTVVDGALPCLVKVTGTADGVEVTLHSVAEAGTTSGSTTSATANVTPLTEMILARAAGTVPAALFENFDSTTASAITNATLNQATTEVLTTLRDVVGVDLGSIDPFKASLVAATASNPTGGNSYDVLLDQLNAKVSNEALPQVVSQIASTAPTGTAAPFSLADVMGNVNAGSLVGCAPALSGKYRVIEYTGAIVEVDINFGTLKLNAPDGEETIVPSTTQACQFSVGVTNFAIGPSGAGAIVDDLRVGYIFPVQAHSFASVQGKWNFVESGIEETNLGVHFMGEADVAADGKVSLCEYDVMNNNFTTCEAETEEAITLQEQTGGHFVLNYGVESSPVYGFRAPNGSLTLFGSNNPGGTDTAGSFRTHFVLTRPQSAVLPAVGAVSNFWDVNQRYVAAMDPTTSNGTLTATIAAESITVTAVDASAATVTRTRARDDRVDTFQINKPIDGLRYRAATTSIPAVYSRDLPGLGMNVAIDGMPNSHFYNISVKRP
jgi:hypothetical protein